MTKIQANHRALLKGAVLLFLSSLFTIQSSIAQAKEQPNIILIMADDLGYECIGANGGTSYQTPVLDGLAKTGMRFEHCYSQPLCTPSRVQIMTGIYNVRNYTKFGLLDRKQTTFAQLLKKAGYATCIAGKWQLGKDKDAAQHFGFDQSCLWQHTRGGRSQEGGKTIDRRFVNPLLEFNGEEKEFTNGEYGPQLCTDFICDFIEENKEKPFLVYYPMILTHCPFDPTPDSSDWDPKRLGSTSYKGDRRDNQRLFGDMLSYADKLVGQIVSQLEKSGVRDNTLILFTGDNGTDQPIVSTLNGTEVAGGKGKMTDAGTRVPLIAHWPGVINTGKVSADLVDFSDFLPTLCETAGVSIPGSLTIDGRSFLPQLQGKKGNPREWIYCWYSRDGKSNIEEWARNRQYKLYRTGKFYDVSKDVLEQDALAELSPQEQQVRTMLQQALDQFKDARPAPATPERKKKKK
ncbi:MAG: sulfatase-like hydrolase/transferase [Akkermansiaceae bacterium]